MSARRRFLAVLAGAAASVAAAPLVPRVLDAAVEASPAPVVYAEVLRWRQSGDDALVRSSLAWNPDEQVWKASLAWSEYGQADKDKDSLSHGCRDRSLSRVSRDLRTAMVEAHRALAQRLPVVAGWLGRWEMTPQERAEFPYDDLGAAVTPDSVWSGAVPIRRTIDRLVP